VKKTYVWAFLVLLAVYIVLAFTLPSDPQVLSKHGLTQLNARLLNLTVVVPIALIYLTALYGFIHVDNYATKIHDTKEGPHFKNLALGLMILVFSLPVTAILGSLRSYAGHELPNLLPTITIVRNYIALAFVLAAIYMIAKGVQGLYGTLKRRRANNNQLVSFYGIIGPVLLASLYTWLIVAQGYETPGDGPYYLPEWVLITTIIVPYVFIWCVGIWAAVYLYRYQAAVKGVIYKRAINYLAKGIAVIILISILVQGLTSLAGVLNRLDLTPLLFIVYLLIGLYVVGYGLVARGAKKLKQIEEA
jgi:hypothetical protein